VVQPQVLLLPQLLPQPQEFPQLLPQPQPLLQPQEFSLTPATLLFSQQGLQQEFATKSGNTIPLQELQELQELQAIRCSSI